MSTNPRLRVAETLMRTEVNRDGTDKEYEKC
jgi:hypothetical protein